MSPDDDRTQPTRTRNAEIIGKVEGLVDQLNSMISKIDTLVVQVGRMERELDDLSKNYWTRFPRPRPACPTCGRSLSHAGKRVCGCTHPPLTK